MTTTNEIATSVIEANYESFDGLQDAFRDHMIDASDIKSMLEAAVQSALEIRHKSVLGIFLCDCEFLDRPDASYEKLCELTDAEWVEQVVVWEPFENYDRDQIQEWIADALYAFPTGARK